ncbi:hypothetical protein L228DRAFT_104887 [Xylona heveae TC161]|uniref:Uncharacterized protein n=1 Tax=Xylona heveae (strain CBS 132557 / TC161) TaxID=1328760 RepID=A0A165H8C1_XYLHT|nr:hypothetical protein L228DRAFT_104887 [Xylona heveae TC161]KZF23125.1 hypothetical protein L228DRAFT_104887 [Xylona heveae TC161]
MIPSNLIGRKYPFEGLEREKYLVHPRMDQLPMRIRRKNRTAYRRSTMRYIHVDLRWRNAEEMKQQRLTLYRMPLGGGNSPPGNSPLKPEQIGESMSNEYPGEWASVSEASGACLGIGDLLKREPGGRSGFTRRMSQISNSESTRKVARWLQIGSSRHMERVARIEQTIDLDLNPCLRRNFGRP